MATSFLIFFIAFLSVLNHVAALPTNKKTAVLTQPKNCLQMTKENEDKINEIVFKVSEYLYNVSVEYDIFDIYLLKIGIEKHIEDDDEEKEVEMKLMINDCATVHPDDYYKSTMDLKFNGDNATVSENKELKAAAQTKPDLKGTKLKNDGKKKTRPTPPKYPRESNGPRIHNGNKLGKPNSNAPGKGTKDKTPIVKGSNPKNNTNSGKPNEKPSIKHDNAKNDEKDKNCNKSTANYEKSESNEEKDKKINNPNHTHNQHEKLDGKDKIANKTKEQLKKPEDKNSQKPGETRNNHSGSDDTSKADKNSKHNQRKSRETSKNEREIVKTKSKKDNENNSQITSKGDSNVKKSQDTVNHEIDKNVKKFNEGNDGHGKPQETNKQDKEAKKCKQQKENENKSKSKGEKESNINENNKEIPHKVDINLKKSDTTNNQHKNKHYGPNDNKASNLSNNAKLTDKDKPENKSKNNTEVETKNHDGQMKQDIHKSKSDDKNDLTKKKMKVKNIWDSGDAPVVMELNLDENGEELLRTLEEKRGKLWPLLMYVQKIDGATEYVILNN